MDNELIKLWQQFKDQPFPASYGGKEISGIDLVETDTFAAGCISSFISNKGVLDDDKAIVLRRCIKDIERILPELSEEAFEYFNKLHNLSSMVLDNCQMKKNTMGI